MAARDDTDLDEALEILSRRVEENNREVERSLENIYGDLEEHDEEIIEIAQFTRHNRDRIEENFNNIDDLWHELDNIYEEIDDVDGGTTNYNLDVDFGGLERAVKYIGGGIRNVFVSGKDMAEESSVSRRKFLAGAGVVAFGADYLNVREKDKDCGDALYRTKETGWDWDFWGEWGEQVEPQDGRCSVPENGNGTPPSDGGAGGETTDPVDEVKTPYDREVELSDDDLQYVIDNTQGTDQELSNIKNIDGNLNDFGYDSNSDEFYVEVEAEDETTRVEISEESYWNVVDTVGN